MDIEEIIQKSNKLFSKINSFGKLVQFVTEELTPNLFKEDTEKVYKLNKKIINGLIHRL
jgi:hypothetical protein